MKTFSKHVTRATLICILVFELMLYPFAFAAAQEASSDENVAAQDNQQTESESEVDEEKQEESDAEDVEAKSGEEMEEGQSEQGNDVAADDNAEEEPDTDADKKSEDGTTATEEDEGGNGVHEEEQDEADGADEDTKEKVELSEDENAETAQSLQAQSIQATTTSTTTDSIMLMGTTTSFENLESTATGTGPTASSTQASSSLASTSASTTTTIVSGQSIALANVLNLVNSNFINSEGVVLFSNFFETVFGAIDFRQYFAGASEAYGCSLVSCQGNNVAVNINNNASIDNEIVISANSGENLVDTAQNGVIQTGNAYAGLNLVNVANTNLVDSSYLLVTLNAFQDVNGDIVFPSLSQFFSSLAQGASSPSAIAIENQANVENTVSVEANAGDNTIEDANSSTIETGDAYGTSNVFNQLNSSLIGGQSVSVIFRVHGSWAGEIFGAPENLVWTAGDDGSIYLFNAAQRSGNGQLEMNGSSTASIRNNVSVVALTGENAITNAETAVIQTGNAYAGANIINVANANVIGRNWILAVINIFGDFNGNIAFGRPDLWVGGQIDVPRSVTNGSQLQYTLTVLNNGDSPASDVTLDATHNGNYLSVQDASHDYEMLDNGIQFALGRIPPGGAAEVTYTATVQNTDEGTDIINTAQLFQRETDNNTQDNTEVLSVTTDEREGGGIRIELGSKKDTAQEMEMLPAPADALVVTRSTDTAVLQNGDRNAEQTLMLRNTSDQTVGSVVLHDKLFGPSGNLIRDEVWQLGDVLPNEEIELGYTITFNEEAVSGTYTLDTVIETGSTTLEFAGNGSIEYEKLQELFAAAFANAGVVAGAATSTDAEAVTISDKVYRGRETPLVPVFDTPVAQAAETENGSHDATDAPVDPVTLFFVAASGLLAASYIRLVRDGGV